MAILLFPFKVGIKLVEIVFKLTGRFLAVILGMVFIVVGIALSLTIIGAIIGGPLGLLGLALVIRGLF